MKQDLFIICRNYRSKKTDRRHKYTIFSNLEKKIKKKHEHTREIERKAMHPIHFTYVQKRAHIQKIIRDNS